MPDGADLVHRRLEARARQELASLDNGVAFAFGASEPTPAEIADAPDARDPEPTSLQRILADRSGSVAADRAAGQRLVLEAVEPFAELIRELHAPPDHPLKAAPSANPGELGRANMTDEVSARRPLLDALEEALASALDPRYAPRVDRMSDVGRALFDAMLSHLSEYSPLAKYQIGVYLAEAHRSKHNLLGPPDLSYLEQRLNGRTFVSGADFVFLGSDYEYRSNDAHRLLFNETAGSAVTTAGGSNYLAIFLAVIVFVGIGFILTSIFSSRPPRRGFPAGPPRYGQHMDVTPNHDALSSKVRGALRVLENGATHRPAAARTRPV